MPGAKYQCAKLSGFAQLGDVHGSFGFNVQNASDEELNERTRERFREKLKKGELEDRKIDIEVKSNKAPMMQVFGPAGMEEMGVNLQDMLGGLGGKNKKTKRRN